MSTGRVRSMSVAGRGSYDVDMADGWRRVELPGGTSFSARRDSPVDAAFAEGATPAPDVPMTWSLGVLGDLMWMRLPESRPFLAELITSEVAEAIEYGRGLMLLVGEIVPDALWHPVMRPALDDYPRTRDRVVAQLGMVREAYLADHPDRDATRGALQNYVLYNLQERRYLTIVEEVDPELAALIHSVMRG